MLTPGPVQHRLSGLRHPIVALPFVIFIGLIAGRQWKLLGAYAAGFHRGAAVVDHRAGHHGPALALRPVRLVVDDVVAVPRRPALDRLAGGGADGVRPVAASALAALVVGVAARIRADSPGGQRRGCRPGLRWSGGGLVRRALVVLVVGTPALEVPSTGGGAHWPAGFVTDALTVVRPGGRGRWNCRRPTPPAAMPSSNCTVLKSSAAAGDPAVLALAGVAGQAKPPRCRCRCTAPWSTALMTIAVRGPPISPTPAPWPWLALDRGWTVFAHTPRAGRC